MIVDRSKQIRSPFAYQFVVGSVPGAAVPHRKDSIVRAHDAVLA